VSIHRTHLARRGLGRASRLVNSSAPAAEKRLKLGREWVIAGRKPRLHVLQKLSPLARENLRTWYRRDDEFLDLLGTLELLSGGGPLDTEPPR
jgi:hypothetical protein